MPAPKRQHISAPAAESVPAVKSAAPKKAIPAARNHDTDEAGGAEDPPRQSKGYQGRYLETELRHR